VPDVPQISLVGSGSGKWRSTRPWSEPKSAAGSRAQLKNWFAGFGVHVADTCGASGSRERGRDAVSS
jgi:hypothetical protein